MCGLSVRDACVLYVCVGVCSRYSVCVSVVCVVIVGVYCIQGVCVCVWYLSV